MVYQLICETEPDASDVLPFNILTKKQTLLCELKKYALKYVNVLRCSVLRILVDDQLTDPSVFVNNFRSKQFLAFEKCRI